LRSGGDERGGVARQVSKILQSIEHNPGGAQIVVGRDRRHAAEQRLMPVFHIEPGYVLNGAIIAQPFD